MALSLGAFRWASAAATGWIMLVSIARCASATTTPTIRQLVIDPDDHWTSLNRTEFTGNTRLQDVSIESNHILRLGTTLAHHPHLRTLHLNDNPGFDLDANDAAQLRSQSLLALELNGCRLRDLATRKAQPFGHLPHLRSLSLERNELTGVAADMLVGTNVTELSLCGNAEFRFADDQPVLNSPRLEVLRCNRCGVTVIYTRTFEQLPRLRRLELNANRLQLVEALAFRPTTLMRELQLNDNRLRAFALETLDSMPELRELCLDCNEFEVNTATSELKRHYVARALRRNCAAMHSGHPERAVRRLEDVMDYRMPGISDAYIASYLVVVVALQAAVALVLMGWCVRERRRQTRQRQRQQQRGGGGVTAAVRRGSQALESEFDYSLGVTNDSCVYRYVR